MITSESKRDEIMTMFATTAGALNKTFSDDQLALISGSIFKYEFDQVKNALERVLTECKFFSLAEVIERIEDGRTSPEAAWALMPVTESQSVCWTEEMKQAFYDCEPLLDGGKNIPARMAFIESYKKRLAVARVEGAQSKYSVSLGSDEQDRVRVLTDAVGTGKIERDHAAGLLPSSIYTVKEGGKMLLEAYAGKEPVKLLESDSEDSGFVSTDKFTELAQEVLGVRKPYEGKGVFNKPTNQEIEEVITKRR